MNSYTINETIDVLAKKAREKSRLSLRKLSLLGIMAGAFIALGYLAYLRLVTAMPADWGSFSTFLGACLFPIGILAITFLGGELVTGNMLVMTFGLLKQQVNLKDVLRNWLAVLLANCFGGILMAYLFGHIVGLTEGAYAAKTIAIAAAKLADVPLAKIVSGIGCNIFVGFAIFAGTLSKDFVGKVIGLWFPVMVFVICGFQHVVANAFILAAALFAGADFSGWALLENILLVFVGNGIGGALFLALPVYLANLPSKTVAEKETENVEGVM